MSKDFEQAFREYKIEYSLTKPPPEQRDYKARLPIQFWLFLPVALLGPIVSGLRTATVFERASGTASLADWAPMVVAILGTLVVELGVVGFQIERLRRLAEGKKTLPPASEGWIILGLVCAFGIALIANLDIVFLDALIAAGVSVPAWIEPLLVGLFLGGGVPLLALVAGEIVGRMIVEVQAANAKEMRRYRKDLRAWREGLKASWDRVKKRRLSASARPVAEGAKPSQPVARASARPMTEDDGQEVEWSEAMAGHLKAIQQAVTDRQGGNGSFKRRDVERWQEVGASQAKNILRYGQDRGLVEMPRRGIYRFVANQEGEP